MQHLSNPPTGYPGRGWGHHGHPQEPSPRLVDGVAILRGPAIAVRAGNGALGWKIASRGQF